MVSFLDWNSNQENLRKLLEERKKVGIYSGSIYDIEERTKNKLVWTILSKNKGKIRCRLIKNSNDESQHDFQLKSGEYSMVLDYNN